MSWLTRRLDHLGSAAAGGVGGIGFSQAPAFTHAYLQRLGGHIDEAQRTIDMLRAGEILPWLGKTGREQAVAELSQRLDELIELRQVLLDAPSMLRPFTLLRHADWSIARSAAEAFAPSIPIDPASIAWTAIGIVAAALAWDGARIPFWTARRIRARRAARQAATSSGSSTATSKPAAGKSPKKAAPPPASDEK